MSLACIETHRNIMFGEPLYGLNEAGSPMVTAVCQEVMDRVPLTDRQAEKIETGGGVNVYDCFSGENFNGAYCWTSFRCGDFLFAVSAEVARRAFPTFMSGQR